MLRRFSTMLCDRTNRDVNMTVVKTMAKTAIQLRVLFALKLRFVNVRMIDFCPFMVSPPYSWVRPSSMWMVRSACAAISGLWVIMTMV